LFGAFVIARLGSEGLQVGQILPAHLQGRNAVGQRDASFCHESDETALARAGSFGEVLKGDVGEVGVSVLAHAIGEVEQHRLCVRLDLFVAHLTIAIGVDLVLKAAIVVFFLGRNTNDHIRAVVGRRLATRRRHEREPENES